MSALLVSCGATRHLAPSNAEELTRFVLTIKELPDGTVTHSWQHAEEADLARYRIDWLKGNYKLILVGSVVVIAGVAFVVVSAGTGAVLLAPVVLLAAPLARSESLMATVEP